MGSKKDSKRVSIAVISLLAVFVFLCAFTVIVYQGKRNGSESDPLEDGNNPASASSSENVTPTDLSTQPDEQESTQASDVSETTSTVQTTASTDAATSTEATTAAETDKNKNEYIVNPDYQSEYYVVVYLKSQSFVVYKKDKSGKYTNEYKTFVCSTGAPDTTPTKTGVYKISKKSRWKKLSDNYYHQFTSLIDETEGYHICSVAYKQKKGSTMIDSQYDGLGQAVSSGSIQLSVGDARWVNLNLPAGTQISIADAEGAAGQSLPKRNTKSKYSGYDPTDQWASGTPYFSTGSTTSTES